MTTEWRATDSRWWPWQVVGSVAVGGVPLLLELTREHQPLWPELIVFPVAAVLNLVGTARGRLRLSDEGVEVRRLRTRVYRWSDIASVERAPEWEHAQEIWLRLRGSVPTSAPEVLVPPGQRARAAQEQALGDIVAFIRRRAGLEQGSPARSVGSVGTALTDPASGREPGAGRAAG